MVQKKYGNDIETYRNDTKNDMKSVQRGKRCGNITQIMRKRKSSAKIETKRIQKQCKNNIQTEM